MTTIIQPSQPAVPAADPLRPVAVAANLLPAEIVGARQARHARRVTVSALIALVLVIGAWYGMAVLQTEAASSDLARAEDDAVTLTRQQQQFKDVIAYQADTKKINDELVVLLADDLRWGPLLSRLRQATPQGVELASVTAGLDGPAGSGTGAGGPGNAPTDSTRLPGTTDRRTIGTVTITGTAGTKRQVAEYVDDLSETAGVADPYLSGAVDAGDSSGFQFTVRLWITDDVLGGRWSTPNNQGGR